MICAVVSPVIAFDNQFRRNGVHQVYFMELIDGRWAAPIQMVELVPEAFPEYSTEDVSDTWFVPPNSEV